MKPDLERLLKAMDAFRQAANREEDARLRAFYHAELETVADARKVDRDTLDRVIMRSIPVGFAPTSRLTFPGRWGLISASGHRWQFQQHMLQRWL